MHSSGCYGQKADKKINKPVTISGKVTDADNQPVAGAVILCRQYKNQLFNQ